MNSRESAFDGAVGSKYKTVVQLLLENVLESYSFGAAKFMSPIPEPLISRVTNTTIGGIVRIFYEFEALRSVFVPCSYLYRPYTIRS